MYRLNMRSCGAISFHFHIQNIQKEICKLDSSPNDLLEQFFEILVSGPTKAILNALKIWK